MTNILYEKRLLQRYSIIAGMDEAGRGCLAGPVVSACIVVTNPIKQVQKVTDSKLLKPERRNELYIKIRETSVEYKIAIATPEEIDEINILRATQLSMNRVISGLTNKPNLTLVDGRFPQRFEFKAECIVKGDLKHYSIAAASILAKVYRDNLMKEYDTKYPEYGFAQHKGYGTKQHLDAINQYGLCPIHRKTFMSQLKLF